MIALSNRVHLFAHPESKEKLTEFFTDIFGCEAVAMPGTPIVLFRFPGGGALTVDFTVDALGEQQSKRGAWLEVKTDNAEALKTKVLGAGLPQVEYPASGRFYFQAPGGKSGASSPLPSPKVKEANRIDQKRPQLDAGAKNC